MPRHVIVDGSNIATEGRSLPSLKQLNEAVLAYMEEHPGDTVTVVVDATFGHRISSAEVPEFDEAIANNELVCPPAGAIGRGDAFLLQVAHKANATVFSNDSFQEFHGLYPWLFEEGRLVGGKPVPSVGWVFVNRTPVRGPLSRRAIRDSKKGTPRRVEPAPKSRSSAAASQPMPVPKVPPPRKTSGAKEPAKAAAPAAAAVAPGHATVTVPAKHEPINDIVPFLAFLETHPVGTTIDATVAAYSSHGAYVTYGDIRGYVPLRFMADPAPRAAREVLALGTVHRLVVVSFNAGRRGIDLAVPGFEPPAAEKAASEPAVAPRRKARRGERAEAAVSPEAAEATVTPTEREAPETPSRPADGAKPARRGRKAPAPVSAAEAAVVGPEAAAPPAPKRTRAAKATEPAAVEAKPTGRKAARAGGAARPSEAPAAAKPGPAEPAKAPKPTRPTKATAAKPSKATEPAKAPAPAKVAKRATTAPEAAAPGQQTPAKAAKAARSAKGAAPTAAAKRAAAGTATEASIATEGAAKPAEPAKASKAAKAPRASKAAKASKADQAPAEPVASGDAAVPAKRRGRVAPVDPSGPTDVAPASKASTASKATKASKASKAAAAPAAQGAEKPTASEPPPAKASRRRSS